MQRHADERELESIMRTVIYQPVIMYQAFYHVFPHSAALGDMYSHYGHCTFGGNGDLEKDRTRA